MKKVVLLKVHNGRVAQLRGRKRRSRKAVVAVKEDKVLLRKNRKPRAHERPAQLKKYNLRVLLLLAMQLLRRHLGVRAELLQLRRLMSRN